MGKQTLRKKVCSVYWLPFRARQAWNTVRDNRGITLMETLVASVVCCLVLIAASLSFVEAQRQFAKAKAAAILEAEARGFFAYAEEEIRRCDRFHKKNNQ